MIKPQHLLLIAAILLGSCKTDNKKHVIPATVVDTINTVRFNGGNKTSLPVLFSNKEATILSWVKSINDSITQLNYATLIDDEWEQSKEITTGNNWFVNWADFPAISANNGNIIAHNLKKSSDATFAYDIELNMLPKGASEWKSKLPLHTDGTKTEHGFVTMLPYKKDSFFITWLDGRNTGNKKGHGHSDHGGAMTIRAAEVFADGTVGNDVLLDSKTCSCCQTTAAITENGPIVLYRDRTDSEIRDIAITRQVKGKWTKPKFIFNDGWEIKGCPVNGPKVDAIANTVAVTWFTAVNGEPKVKAAFSDNGGEDFTAPILISNPETIGRLDLVLIDKENAIVSWLESEDKTTYLKAMKVTKSGTKSKAITISKMNAARKTGFPQMTRANDKLYFAWTSLENETTSIKSAYVPLELF